MIKVYYTFSNARFLDMFNFHFNYKLLFSSTNFIFPFIRSKRTSKKLESHFDPFYLECSFERKIPGACFNVRFSI